MTAKQLQTLADTYHKSVAQVQSEVKDSSYSYASKVLTNNAKKAPAVSAPATSAPTPTYSPAYVNEAAKNKNVNSMISDAYWKALGRKPDSSGLKSYAAAIRNGTFGTVDDLVNDIRTSAEYKKLGPQGVMGNQYKNSGQEAVDKTSVNAEFIPYYDALKTNQTKTHNFDQQNNRTSFGQSANNMVSSAAQRGLGESPAGFQDVFDLSRGTQRNYEQATNLFNQAMSQLNQDKTYNIQNALIGRKNEYSQRYYGDMTNGANSYSTNTLLPYLSKFNY